MDAKKSKFPIKVTKAFIRDAGKYKRITQDSELDEDNVKDMIIETENKKLYKIVEVIRNKKSTQTKEV